jgi:hypothetical protein
VRQPSFPGLPTLVTAAAAIAAVIAFRPLVPTSRAAPAPPGPPPPATEAPAKNTGSASPFRARVADPAGRVRAARTRLAASLPARFVERGIAWPPAEVFLRAVKQELDGSPGVVELWAGNESGPLVLVLSHRICALSGNLGPKRREGDGQIPEGFYKISLLNPTSSFHLSMLVDYPNGSDRVRGHLVDAHAPLGGAIMVHGSCVTIGCIPIEDEPIEEIYLVVAEVLAARPVPIHIYPRRLPDDVALAALQATTADPATKALWAELAAGWQAFERTRRVPGVRVGKGGVYVVTPRTGP